jgi:hypothetical protein
MKRARLVLLVLCDVGGHHTNYRDLARHGLRVAH